MTRQLTITAALICLITVTTQAQPPAPAPGAKQITDAANRFMAAFDRNGDGIVSKGEVPKNIWEKMAPHDTNKTGSISLNEALAFYHARTNVSIRNTQATDHEDSNREFMNQLAAGKLGKPNMSPQDWEVLKPFDRDSNGRISASEAANFLEVQQARQAPQAPQTPNPRKMFNSIDRNNDGTITRNETAANIWQRLKRADFNNDNHVTFDELTKYQTIMRKRMSR